MQNSRPKMIPVSDVRPERLELKRLQSRVERLFSALEEVIESGSGESLSSISPTIDLCETPEVIRVSVELPGVPPENINLNVTAKDICIEGEKKHSQITEKATSHFCCERQYGIFKRRINLRWAININETTAELKDGTLTIRLPKLTDRRGKSVRIPIESKE